MYKVSIILACYNVEGFIDDAFRSIVAQSAFDQFEVIPVNDGSTDGTQRIIDEYQRRYPNNFFPISFEKGSGGPGRPRNAGIDNARGEYIIFMDPDDRILGDGYTTLLKAMEKYRSDVVIATRYGVREKQGPENKVWTDYIAPEYFNQDSYAVKLDLLSRRPVILKTIYRAALMQEHNLRFLEGIASSEDEIFDMKYLLLSSRITKINDVVYLYTVERTGSITSRIKLNLYRDLPMIFSGMHDALGVYFGQPIISYRLAALVRTFYFPKLLLLDPELTDDALDLIRATYEEYGFDRLMLTENSVDRRMVELLRDRKYTQLMLYFMNHRSIGLSGTLRKQNRRLRKLEMRPVKLAGKVYKYAVFAKRAASDRSPRKFLRANLRDSLRAEPNGYWLFMDRRDKAADNAEALYRYVRENNLHDRIAFIVRADCPDYGRLRRDGFNLVRYGTVAHWRLLFNCEYFFASHVDDVIIRPWKEYGARVGPSSYKLIFLQHGIIRSDLSSWLGTKEYHLFCSSSQVEYDALLNNIRYRLSPETLKLTGLARHDLLERRSGDYILVSPTWRSFLQKASRSEFEASEFCKSWNALLRDDRLQAALRAAGVRIKFVLHSSLSHFEECFSGSDLVEVLAYNRVESFADLISGAQMVVTDYSSLSFDALYLRRPVVYYTFPELRTHGTNVGSDLALYKRLGVRSSGHDAAVEAIIASAGQGFLPDEETVREIDSFFAYSDGQNCKRIIDAVIQKERHA
ncbi:bifunctional glycosyltransferase/CDP-glycerol:glycerophosphate glycerophosphotransferase [Salinispora arenicola]|uniref:bifunctional glycosyltransferase/CDP-glycerol:glycerophosphate glycerophosphotransferase n=1 Tax=Salinispora arenicola TaxID=168697 RepID=UPI0020794B2E|nr:glycosyltransferase [Salinispora arenicola]MCN0178062.1 CDP-glycerol:glycerophosphate glycerophosphotransferase [Salinispora arenicola]